MNTESPKSQLHWFDGMLLMPYHLRYGFQRADNGAQYRYELSQPSYYGVVSLEYKKSVFYGGIFELTKFEGILPDGSIVKYDVNEEGTDSLRVDLRGSVEVLRTAPLFIYLGVTSGGNDELQSNLKRFNLDESIISTYGGKGSESHTVMTLRPQMALFLTDSPPPRMSTIPLAQVAWEHESFALTPFIPPSLIVPVDSAVGEICRQVIDRIREKTQYLAGRIQNPQPGMSELTIQELKFYVSCLTSSLPALEVQVYSGNSHPYDLFLTLARIAGNVAALGIDRIPPPFKPYSHDDIFASFEQLRIYILQMIAEGVIESYVRIGFLLEDGMFKVELKNQWQESDFIIAAHPKLGVGASELNSWIMGSVIGTQSILPSLKLRRVLGVERAELDRVNGVVTAKGTLLYHVSLHPDFVTFGENLCVENTLRELSSGMPAELSLYVKVRT